MKRGETSAGGQQPGYPLGLKPEIQRKVMTRGYPGLMEALEQMTQIVDWVYEEREREDTDLEWEEPELPTPPPAEEDNLLFPPPPAQQVEAPPLSPAQEEDYLPLPPPGGEEPELPAFTTRRRKAGAASTSTTRGRSGAPAAAFLAGGSPPGFMSQVSGAIASRGSAPAVTPE
ncbi:UNVERIFIED_CONTAM: hypothetical protein FKN15_002105 [Acipenser sinensis]